jgi:hypothetical protein
MRAIGYLAVRLLMAVSALWPSCAGSAWGGDGGGSLQTLQAILSDPDNGLCVLFGIDPCPQLPTITQAVLEIAGLQNSPPETVRAGNSVPPGSWVDAGNPAYDVNNPIQPPIVFPLTATTSPTLSNLLSTLTPLAFVSASIDKEEKADSNNNEAAAATQLYDPDADTFLYAVTSGSVGPTGMTVPDALYLFYDNLSRNSQNFTKGQVVGKFSLPLTVLNMDGSERQVVTTLQFTAPTTDCSASKVTGDFLNTGMPQTRNATDIGLKCAVVFGASPTSRRKHAIFQVTIPLVVIHGNPQGSGPDQTYFWFALTRLPGPVNMGIFSVFFNNETGFTPTKSGILPSGASIGIAPSAGPLGPPPSCTPSSSCTPPPSTFALCASLPRNGNGQPLVPSVAADYAITTSGETRLSAPLPSVSTSACPF